MIEQFLLDNAVLLATTLVAHFLLYLMHVVMARSLGPDGYGALASLLALMYLRVPVTTTIQFSAARVTSVLVARGQREEAGGLLLYLSRRLAPYALAVFIFLLVASPPIASFLNLQSSWLVVLVGLTFFLAAFLSINRGLLQGRQEFGGLGGNLIVEAASRLIFALLLVGIGWGVQGATLSYALGMLLAYLAALYPLRAWLAPKAEVLSDLKIDPMALTILMTNVGLALLFNTDMLVVKHYFPEEMAGTYAALSFIGKIIVFLGGPITMVMFPMVSELAASKRRSYVPLQVSILLTLLASLAVIVACWLWPTLIVRSIFGSQYRVDPTILVGYSIAMALFALNNLFANFQLALSKRAFLGPLLLAVPFQLLLFFFLHHTFEQIVLSMYVTLGLLLLYFLITGREHLMLRHRRCAAREDA